MNVKKKGVAFMAVLALLPVVAQSSVALADEKENKSSDDYVQVSVADLGSTLPVVDFGKSATLPQNKQAELAKLAKNESLSNSEVAFLEDQYLELHPTSQLESSKLKASVVKKVLKAAWPTAKKLLKKAGVKGISKNDFVTGLLDAVTGASDEITSRLTKALRKMGVPKKAASAIARVIVFLLM